MKDSQGCQIEVGDELYIKGSPNRRATVINILSGNNTAIIRHHGKTAGVRMTQSEMDDSFWVKDPTNGEKLIYIHLNAGHTTNGNPRRVFVVVDVGTGNIVDAIDEGYRGTHDVQTKYPGIVAGPEFTTTPAEYRGLLKQFNIKD